MARQRPGIGGASPEARVAAGIARRVVRGVATGGASVMLELKLLALSLAGLLALVLVLSTVLLIVGSKAQGLAADGVTPTCAGADASAPPADLMPIYDAAARRYRLGPEGWSVLAAINRIETGFGHDTSNSSAGAQGWMQFLPATWATYGADGDGDGDRDIQDKYDAIYGAANYLHASGAPGDWYDAVHAYNHADWYVQDVLAHAEAYRGACGTSTYGPAPTTPGHVGKLLPNGTVAAPEDAPEEVKRLIAAANEIANKPYVWGGGHNGWDAPGYDCSGLTSYALSRAGLLPGGAMISTGFERYGLPGPGTWVTIYANSEHVFMVVTGLRLDTGGNDRHGSAWRAPNLTRARSYAGFVVRHPTGL